MRPSSLHFFPIAWPFLLALGALFLVAIALLEFHVLKYAYERMGISRRYILVILLLSLLGSYVNIPVAELAPEEVVSDQVVTANGVQYIVPAVDQGPRTIIAVNVGGALIPTLLSVYLIIKNRLYVRGFLGVVIVA